ncbi:MAG: hypothetical protein KAU03_03350 [Candidatus Altiarchaeales archaeon]|nr:hypothetical protein [Candidatus Altiarchaeales archaeon]
MKHGGYCEICGEKLLPTPWRRTRCGKCTTRYGAGKPRENIKNSRITKNRKETNDEGINECCLCCLIPFLGLMLAYLLDPLLTLLDKYASVIVLMIVITLISYICVHGYEQKQIREFERYEQKQIREFERQQIAKGLVKFVDRNGGRQTR